MFNLIFFEQLVYPFFIYPFIYDIDSIILVYLISSSKPTSSNLKDIRFPPPSIPAPTHTLLLTNYYLLSNLLFYRPNYLSLLIKAPFSTELIIIPGILRGVVLENTI
jgi:hypothetical protein